MHRVRGIACVGRHVGVVCGITDGICRPCSCSRVRGGSRTVGHVCRAIDPAVSTDTAALAYGDYTDVLIAETPRFPVSCLATVVPLPRNYQARAPVLPLLTTIQILEQQT